MFWLIPTSIIFQRLPWNNFWIYVQNAVSSVLFWPLDTERGSTVRGLGWHTIALICQELDDLSCAVEPRFVMSSFQFRFNWGHLLEMCSFNNCNNTVEHFFNVQVYIMSLLSKKGNDHNLLSRVFGVVHHPVQLTACCSVSTLNHCNISTQY